MSVYVDDMKCGFGRMVMSHMIATTTEELLAMADKIGVQRKWIQYSGTFREHFDIAQIKRRQALKHGAKEITWQEYALMVGARREYGKMPGLKWLRGQNKDGQRNSEVLKEKLYRRYRDRRDQQQTDG